MSTPITSRDRILLSLITALATLGETDAAVSAVAAQLCLPEEAVRDVVDELESVGEVRQ